MPRPKTKMELLELGKANYRNLMNFVRELPREELENEFPPGYLNRNIRDVLAHLHHWHLMMLEWYKVGMSGIKPDMPSKGYTWKTVPELNRKIQDTYSNVDLKVVKDSFEESFENLQEIIAQHTEEELFEKKHYPWTGSTSLGAYFISATSSHYDWALKLIKKCRKQLAQ
ncbi:ClbS/DfsB family four-helix bundle protein [Ulvibacterium marinum]|uniref:ClbS/DfsB family four-helix bundle protein n=1 Tax=Ulvibacterium marinum TaxID=2419782 RepID=UPI002493FA04|nr:ClbS/DfsB family four-helix bundle protein [Ulvibacterium marinum]